MKTELLKLKIQAKSFSGVASLSYWTSATEVMNVLKLVVLSACWS